MSAFDDDKPEIDPEEVLLDELGQRFLRALADKDAGKIDRAEEELRAILMVEPRLGEPRMELARIFLDSDRLSDAEDHAREAVETLEGHGTWTDELPKNVVLGLAHGLLAEVLRRRADEDDVIFGDATEFHALVAEAKKHFERAAELDPADEYASWHAYFLGVKGHGAKVDFGDGVEDDGEDIN